MSDLIRLVRDDGEIADVRPDWVAEWRARGWRVEGENAPKPRGRPRKEAEK